MCIYEADFVELQAIVGSLRECCGCVLRREKKAEESKRYLDREKWKNLKTKREQAQYLN